MKRCLFFRGTAPISSSFPLCWLTASMGEKSAPSLNLKHLSYVICTITKVVAGKSIISSFSKTSTNCLNLSFSVSASTITGFTTTSWTKWSNSANSSSSTSVFLSLSRHHQSFRCRNQGPSQAQTTWNPHLWKDWSYIWATDKVT